MVATGPMRRIQASTTDAKDRIGSWMFAVLIGMEVMGSQDGGVKRTRWVRQRPLRQSSILSGGSSSMNTTVAAWLPGFMKVALASEAHLRAQRDNLTTVKTIQD